jgi:hypothetical protein
MAKCVALLYGSNHINQIRYFKTWRSEGKEWNIETSFSVSNVDIRGDNIVNNEQGHEELWSE